jgi:hypothetical protein
MTIRHGTTAAATLASVDLPADYGSVAVLHYSGTTDLLVRVDGGVPALTGDGSNVTRVVPPGSRRIIDRSNLDGPTQVRLLSTGVVGFEIEV